MQQRGRRLGGHCSKAPLDTGVGPSTSLAFPSAREPAVKPPRGRGRWGQEAAFHEIGKLGWGRRGDGRQEGILPCP